MFVMHTISAPARRIRSVTVASCLGTKPWRMAEPQVSGMPAIATESFIARRCPERIPSHPSARTRQLRTIALSGSSAALGRSPASRTAATGAGRSGSWVSSRSSVEKMASATASSSPASSADGS